MKHTTSKEYAETGGKRCPACNSEEIFSYSKMDYDDNWAAIDIECHDCGATWKDIYILNGYSDLETNQ